MNTLWSKAWPKCRELPMRKGSTALDVMSESKQWQGRYVQCHNSQAKAVLLADMPISRAHSHFTKAPASSRPTRAVCTSGSVCTRLAERPGAWGDGRTCVAAVAVAADQQRHSRVPALPLIQLFEHHGAERVLHHIAGLRQPLDLCACTRRQSICVSIVIDRQ